METIRKLSLLALCAIGVAGFSSPELLAAAPMPMPEPSPSQVLEESALLRSRLHLHFSPSPDRSRLGMVAAATVVDVVAVGVAVGVRHRGCNSCCPPPRACGCGCRPRRSRPARWLPFVRVRLHPPGGRFHPGLQRLQSRLQLSQRVPIAVRPGLLWRWLWLPGRSERCGNVWFERCRFERCPGAGSPNRFAGVPVRATSSNIASER